MATTNDYIKVLNQRDEAITLAREAHAIAHKAADLASALNIDREELLRYVRHLENRLAYSGNVPALAMPHFRASYLGARLAELVDD